MNIDTICIEGKYKDDTEYYEDLKTSDMAVAKKKLAELKSSGKVKVATLKIKTSDGEEIPLPAFNKMTEALNTDSSLEPGMFMTNENGTIVFIKEIENNIVVFDEEGTERILTYSMFLEYANQEGYKHMKIKTPTDNPIREVVESSSVENAVKTLTENKIK